MRQGLYNKGMHEMSGETLPTSIEEKIDGPWELWRQDDPGNQFKIRGFDTEEEANEAMVEFEERGHKQMYWVALRPETES